jgi:hypothetical protein
MARGSKIIFYLNLANGVEMQLDVSLRNGK